MKNRVLILLLTAILILSLFAASCSLFEQPYESKNDDEETQDDEDEQEQRDSILTRDTQVPETTQAPQAEETRTVDDNPAATATPKPIYTPVPAGTAAPTSTPAPEGTLPQLDFSQSGSLIAGPYIFVIAYGADGYDEYDIQFYIHDDRTGTYYISDAQNNVFDAYDFTYTWIDETLTFLFDTGEMQQYYFSYGESGGVYLRELDNMDIQYVYEMPYLDLFTSFGSWVAVNNDGTFGYVCYWYDGTGYSKNWEHVDRLVPITWDYGYSMLSSSPGKELGFFEDAFVEHYGSITEYTYYDYDEDEYVTKNLYRAQGDIMYGYYRLNTTDAQGVIIKELTLYDKWDAQCVISEDGVDTFCDYASWSVSSVDSNIDFTIKYKDEYIKVEYEYFYGGDVLILRDRAGHVYSFDKGIDME